ncbi:hypothetical protein; Trans-splicing factor Raa3 (fragment) [Bradyrhizobium sp. ORS 278]|uniref:hypothetical protein n=1 Tax=Bradyrhizobium sp. (strain ORS 278) TaxID=114615 RepID=UPI000150878F
MSARHQVNGRIELKAASLPRNGPAEETGFLRSVQIAFSVCNLARLTARARSGPDVFADALDPPTIASRSFLVSCAAPDRRRHETLPLSHRLSLPRVGRLLPMSASAHACPLSIVPPRTHGSSIACAVAPLPGVAGTAAWRRFGDGYRFAKQNGKPLFAAFKNLF